MEPKNTGNHKEQEIPPSKKFVFPFPFSFLSLCVFVCVGGGGERGVCVWGGCVCVCVCSKIISFNLNDKIMNKEPVRIMTPF